MVATSSANNQMDNENQKNEQEGRNILFKTNI